jgi:hypothetical protein
MKGLNGSKKFGVRMWALVCIRKDGNKLTFCINKKEFIVRFASLNTGSSGVLL